MKSLFSAPALSAAPDVEQPSLDTAITQKWLRRRDELTSDSRLKTKVILLVDARIQQI
jgi:hypothetical protein